MNRDTSVSTQDGPLPVSTPPRPWSGRTDGTSAEHRRWHQQVQAWDPEAAAGGVVVIGFACDQGVVRNQGRPGAVAGPAALRGALAPLALHRPVRTYDAGDVEVVGAGLEDAQQRLGRAVATLLDAGHLPMVLGGGHEVAFGTYLGLAGSTRRRDGLRIGVVNIDAHFDLRAGDTASSGTPFRQILECEQRAGTSLQYSVLGISEPANTTALFTTAERFGVRYLLDEQCSAAHPDVIADFITRAVTEVDVVHLSIDLDGLPAGVAPGVSAPAAFGVPTEIVELACRTIAASGKLAVVEVAELNPTYDLDGRTARTAARLMDRIVASWTAPGCQPTRRHGTSSSANARTLPVRTSAPAIVPE